MRYAEWVLSWVELFGMGGTALTALAFLFRRFGGVGYTVRRDLVSVLARAIADAQRRGHPSATVTHLALALLVDPDVGRDLEERGVVLSELYAEIEALLPPAAVPAVSPAEQVDEAVGKLLRRAGGNGAISPAPRRVLRTLLASEESALGEVFARHGVRGDRPRSSSAVTREATTPQVNRLDLGPYRGARDGSEQADTSVVFWNDDKTKMELVTQLLREVFGIAEPRATRLMLTVDRDGFAVVGTYGRAEAKRMVETALVIAKDSGAPLRITIEEANRRDLRRGASRWLRRALARTHMPVSAEGLRIARAQRWRATIATTDLPEALKCPHCGNASKRYREVDDALVCMSCRRSFARSREESPT
jgi:ATP-dependent Clp protease adaptor protein ClpS